VLTIAWVVLITFIVEARGHRYKAGEWEAGWLDEKKKTKTLFPIYLVLPSFPCLIYLHLDELDPSS
jgi:hypothetical protein